VNLLILNTDLPIFPGGGAVEFLTTRQMARLVDRVGLVSMVHRRSDLEQARALEEAGVEFYLWYSPFIDVPPQVPPRTVLRAAHRLLVGIVHRLATRSDRPADTVIMDGAFRNMSASLSAALARRSWQVLAVIQSNAAAMIDSVPRPVVAVLVMHDIRSLLFERRAAASSSAVERWRLRREARRYFRFERKHCARYDLVVTVSGHDAEWVRTHYAPPRVLHLPLPVDTSYFQPRHGLERPGRILFTGLMSHPPNIDAACYFAREVLPLVRQRVPAAEFQIVGRLPTPEVMALATLPGVIVAGEVPDMRPYYAEASVFVVPLRFGSGARQKILEAWSMEKCVVASSIGAEGLEYRHGHNVAIADSPDAMARTVIEALENPEYRDRLRFTGREVVTLGHDPAAIARTYCETLREIAGEKAMRDEPMRVVLDMRWMVPGLAGGLEQLARSFLEGLVAVDRYNRYTVIVPARTRHDLPTSPNLRIVSPDSAAALAERSVRRVSRRILAMLRLDDWRSPEVMNLQFLRSLEADIAYSFPGYIHPDMRPLRNVLMVPDIQHEYFPEFFSPEAVAERRRLFGDSIARADHICAISEFTRQSLIERLGVSPERVTTLLLAADPVFAAPADREQDAATWARHALEPGYLFFPAHTWHHKNHRAAIEALRILRDRRGRAPRLVCTGAAREAQPFLDTQIRDARLESAVRFLGYVPHRDLPALYRGAAALVYPSLFEGFGMPVLEAMAGGCPVICSNTTSLPEIAGDAALQVDPADHGALADAIESILTVAGLREQLISRGRHQAARFSWQRHTLDAIAVLHRVHRVTRCF
jgi:glycosyltransferase involved in cell wall biosynthesis